MEIQNFGLNYLSEANFWYIRVIYWLGVAAEGRKLLKERKGKEDRYECNLVGKKGRYEDLTVTSGISEW